MKRRSRRGRLLAPDSTATYHCVSRVVDKRFIFGDAEKNVFRSTMRKLEEFCGVQVLTYCLMSNHFHLLVRVPEKAKAPRLTEEALLELLPILYDETQQLAIKQELDRARESADPGWHAGIIARFEARRHDLSAFMRELKQRFTLWYNRSHRRQGTLWEEKFRSVLVDDTGKAPLMVAAYIELNPVRAGVANNPEDYRWCGYAEALAGDPLARAGITGLLERSGWGGKRDWSWEEAVARYQCLLLDKAGPPTESRPARDRSDPLPATPALSSSPVEAAPGAARQDNISPAVIQALRRKVRYFTRGGIVGGEEFVDGFFEANRDRFGPARASGARRLKGADWGSLRVLRDLQKLPLG